MSQSVSILALTVEAAGALTAHRFVGANLSQAGAGANAYGVARTDAAIGESVAVDVLGTAIVEAGAAIAAGAEVEVNASGKAVTQSAGVAVGRLAPGESAQADGDLVEVILFPN